MSWIMASQGPEKGDEIIRNTAMKQADVGYRKGGVQIHDNSDDHRLSFPKFKIRASRCCAAVQEKLHDQVITREFKHVCVFSEIAEQ